MTAVIEPAARAAVTVTVPERAAFATVTIPGIPGPPGPQGPQGPMGEMTPRTVTTIADSAMAALDDAGSYLRFTGATPIFTVPTNATVAFPIGTVIDGVGVNASMTIAPAAGVVINKERTLTTLGPLSWWTLIKVGVDEWDVRGDFVGSVITSISPALMEIPPSTDATGEIAVGLTIVGQDFRPGSWVYAGAQGRSWEATFVSATELTIPDFAPETLGPGVHNLVVTDEFFSVFSNVGVLTVSPVPDPTFTSITPDEGVAGEWLPVTIVGTGFLFSTILMSDNGHWIGTDILSATEARATIHQDEAGVYAYTMVHAWGGWLQQSNSLPVTIAAEPPPVITSIAVRS